MINMDRLKSLSKEELSKEIENIAEKKKGFCFQLGKTKEFTELCEYQERLITEWSARLTPSEIAKELANVAHIRQHMGTANTDVFGGSVMQYESVLLTALQMKVKN